MLNNLRGIANVRRIGAYDEDIYMMKYNEVRMRKNNNDISKERRA